jgi:hypothetical protein
LHFAAAAGRMEQIISRERYIQLHSFALSLASHRSNNKAEAMPEIMYA